MIIDVEKFRIAFSSNSKRDGDSRLYFLKNEYS